MWQLWTWLNRDLVALKLGLMILKVFSNLNNSMTCVSMYTTIPSLSTQFENQMGACCYD